MRAFFNLLFGLNVDSNAVPLNLGEGGAVISKALPN